MSFAFTLIDCTHCQYILLSYFSFCLEETDDKNSSYNDSEAYPLQQIYSIIVPDVLNKKYGHRTEQYQRRCDPIVQLCLLALVERYHHELASRELAHTSCYA